jgi:hypothetical protein
LVGDDKLLTAFDFGKSYAIIAAISVTRLINSKSDT